VSIIIDISTLGLSISPSLQSPHLSQNNNKDQE